MLIAVVLLLFSVERIVAQQLLPVNQNVAIFLIASCVLTVYLECGHGPGGHRRVAGEAQHGCTPLLRFFCSVRLTRGTSCATLPAMNTGLLYMLLRQHGWTPAKLARALGVNRGNVSHWNRNKLPMRRLEDVHQLTGIPRCSLRPDEYAWTVESGSNASRACGA